LDYTWGQYEKFNGEYAVCCFAANILFARKMVSASEVATRKFLTCSEHGTGALIESGAMSIS